MPQAYFFNSLHSAPVGATVTSESTSAIKVSFPAPAVGSAVQAYQASVKDGLQKCSTLVNASSLACSLTELESGTLYAILVTASVESVQSDASEISGYTLPQGNHVFLIFSYLFKIISNGINVIQCHPKSRLLTYQPQL